MLTRMLWICGNFNHGPMIKVIEMAVKLRGNSRYVRTVTVEMRNDEDSSQKRSQDYYRRW